MHQNDGIRHNRDRLCYSTVAEEFRGTVIADTAVSQPSGCGSDKFFPFITFRGIRPLIRANSIPNYGTHVIETFGMRTEVACLEARVTERRPKK
jgi:hypothetical protein